MKDHYETLVYDQDIRDKMTDFDRFEDQIKGIIHTYNKNKKDIDKRELEKLIKNYLGETDYKIEENLSFYQFQNSLTDKSIALKQNQYVELINKLLFMNLVDDSKNQLIIEINKIKKEENILKNKSLITQLEKECDDLNLKAQLIEKINSILSLIQDAIPLLPSQKELYIALSDNLFPREFQDFVNKNRKDNDYKEQVKNLIDFLNDKKNDYIEKRLSVDFINQVISSIVTKEYIESKATIAEIFEEVKANYHEEVEIEIKKKRKDRKEELNKIKQLRSSRTSKIEFEEMIDENVKRSRIKSHSEQQEEIFDENHIFEDWDNNIQKLDPLEEEIIEEEVLKLKKEPYNIQIMKELKSQIEKNDQQEYFSAIKMIDSVKTIPLCFPKNQTFNQITNIKNFCIFFENNDISALERIYFFIEGVMAIERMFYQNQKWFAIKKENLFLDLKTNRIKIITFFSPYEKNYDWAIFFKGIKDIKEKESYLKTFFNFLKRYCLDNEILKIKLNEKGFIVDSIIENSMMLWKNKHVFIFSLIKNYCKQFLQVHNLKVFRNYIKKKLTNPKIIRVAERIRNMIIYFFCKSFKYGPNESFADRPIPQVMDVKYVRLQDNKFLKVTCVLNLKNMNMLVISGTHPLFIFYNYNGLQKKVIYDEKENDSDKIKCMIHLKDINYLVSGSKKGLIYIYELKNFNLLKTLKGHGDNAVKSLQHMKGYLGRNDIFASCSMDKSIVVWDFQKGEKITTYFDNSIILKIYYSKSNNYFISTNKNRELKFWDLDMTSVESKTFHKFENAITFFEFFNNCCGEETICIGSLFKVSNIKKKDEDFMNTNIKLFLTRKCMISNKPAFEFTVIGNVVKAASIFDFGRDIIVTADKTTGKFMFWRIKKDGDEFKELLLCYVIKCGYLFYSKKIITFVYLPNLDKITFCVACQFEKENNTVLFELNSNEK